ncbi:MAG TPA: hotdog domain-containing protein [Pirellulaceae bacterium]|nr:hotdog domain-containing protein [Pirellulaceae bacterium]HMO90986.1 hotdog domain-containing protein [Pirellulaceae bacterium]HMP68101.1 hotdog domain-containing protein [Pirellulaceae bacterium]
METHKLVMPEHLNHYGYLFGGYMLMWVDEIAWIAASLDYPDYNFVTIAMDRVEFRRSVGEGVILAFQTERTRIGKTSVSYEVTVFKARSKDKRDDHASIFKTTVTLVRVDADGQKAPIMQPAE